MLERQEISCLSPDDRAGTSSLSDTARSALVLSNSLKGWRCFLRLRPAGDPVPAQRGVHSRVGGLQRRGDLTDRLTVLDLQLGELLCGDRGGWGSVGPARPSPGNPGRVERSGHAPAGLAEALGASSMVRPSVTYRFRRLCHRWWGWSVPGRSPWSARRSRPPLARMRSRTLESVTPSFLAISATRRPWSSRDRTLFARIAAELRRVILGNHRCVDDWYPLILRQMVVAAVGSGEQERARIQDNPHRSKDWSIAVHS